jgi:hypothetical protein
MGSFFENSKNSFSKRVLERIKYRGDTFLSVSEIKH